MMTYKERQAWINKRKELYVKWVRKNGEANTQEKITALKKYIKKNERI